MTARYVIEEQHSGAWSPAAIPESPYTDDLPRAMGILRALASRRFRVRDTSSVQIMRASTGRPIYVSRTRDRIEAQVR